MGLFDQMIKKTQNAAGDLMKNAGDAIQKFDAEKAKENITNGVKDLADNTKKAANYMAENMPESLSDIDLKKTAGDISDKTKEAYQKWKKDTADSEKQVKEALREETDKTVMLTRTDALRILYCVMACDGKLDEQEAEKLISIGTDMIDNFEGRENEILGDVMNVRKETSGDDYFYDIRDMVNECLNQSEHNRQKADVNGRLLIWNMLAVAESDGLYSKEEKKLIHYTAEKIEINESVVDEMEMSARTIEAVEQEENWLKDQDLKYSEVQPQIEMLEKRKQAVMDGIAALLRD